MKSVVSLKTHGASWEVTVRLGHPVQIVEEMGFSWKPEDRVFTTDDVMIALALLNSRQVRLLVDGNVANAIRSTAAAISMTNGVTETAISVTNGVTETPTSNEAISVMGAVTKTIMVGKRISVTTEVAETRDIEMDAPALDPADTMQEFPVTEGVTEKVAAGNAISVTLDATETPQKRKRGRPPKAEGAFTAAERARRYRRKHTPDWKNRRVDLYPFVFEQIEKIVTETGFCMNEVIYHAIELVPPEAWERRKAATVRLNEKLAAQRREQVDAS